MLGSKRMQSPHQRTACDVTSDLPVLGGTGIQYRLLGQGSIDEAAYQQQAFLPHSRGA